MLFKSLARMESVRLDYIIQNKDLMGCKATSLIEEKMDTLKYGGLQDYGCPVHIIVYGSVTNDHIVSICIKVEGNWYSRNITSPLFSLESNIHAHYNDLVNYYVKSGISTDHS